MKSLWATAALLLLVAQAHADTIPVTIQPAVTFNPSSLTFPLGHFGVPSSPLAVTATNASPYPVTFSGVTMTGPNVADFSETDNCGAALAPGASCTITVTFTPTVAGGETATITIAGNAPAHTYTATARGGSAGPVAISLSNSAPTLFDDAPPGTLVATAVVTTSDNSPYTGSLSIGSQPSPGQCTNAPSGQTTFGIFAINGLNIVTARQLGTGDDGSQAVCVTAN